MNVNDIDIDSSCSNVLLCASLLATGALGWPGLVYASLTGRVYATLTLVSTAHALTRIFRLFSSLCPGLGASRQELAAPSDSAAKQYSQEHTHNFISESRERK